MTKDGFKKSVEFFIHDHMIFKIAINFFILFFAPAWGLCDLDFIFNDLELFLPGNFSNQEWSGLENILLKFFKILKSLQKALDCFSNPLSSVTKILIGHHNNKLDIFDFRECSVVKIGIADHLAAPTWIMVSWKIN